MGSHISRGKIDRALLNITATLSGTSIPNPDRCFVTEIRESRGGEDGMFRIYDYIVVTPSSIVSCRLDFTYQDEFPITQPASGTLTITQVQSTSAYPII